MCVALLLPPRCVWGLMENEHSILANLNAIPFLGGRIRLPSISSRWQS